MVNAMDGSSTGEEFPIGAELDDGALVVTEWIRGDAVRGQYRALDRQGNRLLATVTSRQQVSFDELERNLAFPIDGVAPLRHIGTFGDDEETTALVEEEPAGRPTSEFSLPLPFDQAVELAVDLAALLERAHSAGFALRFLRPELIYAEVRGGAPRLSGVAPRADVFLISAAPIYGAKPLFDQLFAAPEVLTMQKVVTPAADVFSLCAALAVWLSGEHPFEGETQTAQLGSIVSGRGRPWRGPAALGMVLARGLERSPRSRPTLSALVADLRAAGAA
jgi:eukaryotic-like serine/threonine-protein kinase